MTSEQFLRVRGYLTAQGAKVLPEQLIGSVQEAMTKLRETATAASGLTLRVDPLHARRAAATLGRLIDLARAS